MILIQSVNQVEDQRELDNLLKQMEVDAGIALAPVNIHHGKAHVGIEPRTNNGVTYQLCGGGRRVIRKKIGGD